MKKLRHFLATLLVALFVLPASAQWTEVTGFNQVISDLLVFENQMHIVGGFTKHENNTNYWHSIYNGATFQDNQQIFSNGGLTDMAIFNNTLYAVGANGYYTWDGTVFTNRPENSHGSIYTDGNLLYLGSDFGLVRHMDANGNMTSYPQLQGFSSSVQAIIKYNGELIIAGRFDSIGSTKLNGLAKWDGNAWQPIGTGKGVTGGISGSNVRGMIVYKNELYIYGSFTNIDGKQIGRIAKWNGSQWSDVGGSGANPGISNGVRDAIIYNDELYVCGDFSQLGSTQAKYVAKWNGQTWVAINLVETDNFPECITIYKNELYVGTFDFQASNIYKRAIPASVGSVPDGVAELNIYPNPAHNQFAVSAAFSGNINNAEIVIKDINGRIKYISKESNMPVNCSGWAPGIYFVYFSSTQSGASAVKKIVVF